MSFTPHTASPATQPATQPATRGYVLGPDEGNPYHWLGTLSLTKVMGSVTTGNLDIVDHRVPPGYAPPPHVHRDSDEVFFLIDGHLEVHCGDDAWEAGPGSLLFLPRGVPHRFVNADQPARTLLINAPASFADLVVAIGDPAPGLDMPGPDAPVPSTEEIFAQSQWYGINPA